jgi:DNA-binding transcriptional MerR regulator
MLDIERQYTISEVSELTNYPPHVLRYYEKEFELDIPRNESNHRYYTYKEIELLGYIKTLQDKGFSNKQIKLIIKSPELVIDEMDEAAVTSLINRQSLDVRNISDEICTNIEDIIINQIKPLISEKEESNIKLIEGLKEEIVKLRNDLNSKERDVLICENAKLKMKVKEKSYEVAELRDKVKRQESSKNIFKKLFKKV